MTIAIDCLLYISHYCTARNIDAEYWLPSFSYSVVSPEKARFVGYRNETNKRKRGREDGIDI